jgi:hypothetical protein
MKVVVFLVLAAVAAANAKFQFTEEWELWKTVDLPLPGLPSSGLIDTYLCSVDSRKRIFI